MKTCTKSRTRIKNLKNLLCRILYALVELMRGIAHIPRSFEIATQYMIPNDDMHYFIKNYHIGDATRTLSLIRLFKEYHQKNRTFPIKKIVVITTKPIADLATLYSGIDEFIILDKLEINDLIMYLKIHNKVTRKAYNYYLDDTDVTPLLKLRYKLPANIPHQDEIMRLPDKLGHDAVSNALKILEQYNVKPSKTVVIIPYAYSSSNMMNCLEAVEFFLKMEYTVFTNVGSDKEKELPGTIRLDAMPTTVFALGALGCLMVGAQSGFMDTMRWLNINIKNIIVFILKTSGDVIFANNRHLTECITYRENTTYIKLEPIEENTLSKVLIEQSKYYIKGNVQNNLFLCSENVLCGIHSCSNLNDYISEAVKINHTVIFVSVCGSANRYWNKFESRHLLTLKADLAKGHGLSYLAIIDRDDNECIEKLSDEWNGIDYHYSFYEVNKLALTSEVYNNEAIEQYGELPSKNYCWIYSCAMDCMGYTKSSILINGIDYSINKRGINIVIYNKELGRVIDSINVDMSTDPNLTVNRINYSVNEESETEK